VSNTNDSNDSFFQEVEEQVRQDRYVTWANKYGIWVIGAVVAILLAVGGWRLYEGWRVDSSRDTSERFAAAQKLLREGDAKAADEEFERLSKTGPNTYRAMAMMERAQAMEAQGDLQGALAQFDAAAQASTDRTMKDSARLRAAYLVAETQDFAALRGRLDPIIADGGPIAYLARELLGVEAWEAGELTLARETLENLTLAFDAPESVRQRAQVALSVIGPAPAATGATSASPAAAPASPAAAPASAAQPAPGETK